VFSFCSPPLLSVPCARAGTCPIYSSPLLIEAGVGDAFSRWNPHFFALITHAIYEHSHFTIHRLPNLRIWLGLMRAPGRDTTINFTHPSLPPSVANHGHRFQCCIRFSRIVVVHPHNLPHTQCFFVSFCECWLVHLGCFFTNMNAPCNNCTVKVCMTV
jgi:hypothetical protein